MHLYLLYIARKNSFYDLKKYKLNKCNTLSVKIIGFRRGFFALNDLLIIGVNVRK